MRCRASPAEKTARWDRVAVRDGGFAVVGLLASLCPISTVLSARFVFKERIRGIQHVGVVLAVGGVLLLARGGPAAGSSGTAARSAGAGASESA